MSLPKTGESHYHEQLGQRSCYQRVGCLMGITKPNNLGVLTEKNTLPWVFGPGVWVYEVIDVALFNKVRKCTERSSYWSIIYILLFLLFDDVIWHWITKNSEECNAVTQGVREGTMDRIFNF